MLFFSLKLSLSLRCHKMMWFWLDPDDKTALKSAMSTTSGKMAFLPFGTTAFIRRRCIDIVALVLALTAAALATALISYDPADPSLNTATAQPAENPLGATGAAVADLSLQTIGLAAGLIVLVLLAWSWQLLMKKELRRAWLNLAALPFALLLFVMAFAALPFSALDALPGGAGGIVGTTLFSNLHSFLIQFDLGFTLTPVMIGFLLFFPAFFVLAVAMGLSPGEWGVLFRHGADFLALLWRAGSAIIRILFSLLLRPFQRRAEDASASTERTDPALASSASPATPAAARSRAAKSLVADKAPSPRQGKKAQAARQANLSLSLDSSYSLPPLNLLHLPDNGTGINEIDEESLSQNARLLESVLDDFGIRGQIIKVRPGPIVTLYELEPAPGTKTSRVIGLADDIARSMSAISARIAAIPGRNVIGIELPNARREPVALRELLSSDDYERTKAQLPLVLGKDIGGAPVITDLARMPHLLVAGTTGSGKSVAINAMILSLLYRLSPDQCKLILIDPKMLELSVYDDIPHLLAPVVTEPKKAVVALKWTVREMENRYRLMSLMGVRNVAGYNERVAKARKKGEILTRKVQTGFDADTGKPVFEEQPLDLDPMPLIVVIVDEMADLMLVAGKDIEGAIQRLSQMARAAGIHIIMATQRPSVDVITGTIKANFPTRISFQVTSKIDSRTILGEQGAEQLLGQGDMLYMAAGGRITRVHGPFVSDEEVESVVAHLRAQGEPDYLEAVTEDNDSGLISGMDDGGSGDDLYDQAVQLVISQRKASTSFVQRHLQIGYNRAARLIEQMEAQNVIGPANHVGKREILVPDRDA